MGGLIVISKSFEQSTPDQERISKFTFVSGQDLNLLLERTLWDNMRAFLLTKVTIWYKFISHWLRFLCCHCHWLRLLQGYNFDLGVAVGLILNLRRCDAVDQLPNPVILLQNLIRIWFVLSLLLLFCNFGIYRVEIRVLKGYFFRFSRYLELQLVIFLMTRHGILVFPVLH